MRGGIIELTTIVTLNDFDGVAKLRGNKCEKIDNVGKVSDLTRKGKVHKMRVIIKDNQIILVPRNTDN
jgi:hypothetical protein